MQGASEFEIIREDLIRDGREIERFANSFSDGLISQRNEDRQILEAETLQKLKNINIQIVKAKRRFYRNESYENFIQNYINDLQEILVKDELKPMKHIDVVINLTEPLQPQNII